MGFINQLIIGGAPPCTHGITTKSIWWIAWRENIRLKLAGSNPSNRGFSYRCSLENVMMEYDYYSCVVFFAVGGTFVLLMLCCYYCFVCSFLMINGWCLFFKVPTFQGTLSFLLVHVWTFVVVFFCFSGLCIHFWVVYVLFSLRFGVFPDCSITTPLAQSLSRW